MLRALTSCCPLVHRFSRHNPCRRLRSIEPPIRIDADIMYVSEMNSVPTCGCRFWPTAPKESKDCRISSLPASQLTVVEDGCTPLHHHLHDNLSLNIAFHDQAECTPTHHDNRRSNPRGTCQTTYPNLRASTPYIFGRHAGKFTDTVLRATNPHSLPHDEDWNEAAFLATIYAECSTAYVSLHPNSLLVFFSLVGFEFQG